VCSYEAAFVTTYKLKFSSSSCLFIFGGSSARIGVGVDFSAAAGGFNCVFGCKGSKQSLSAIKIPGNYGGKPLPNVGEVGLTRLVVQTSSMLHFPRIILH